MNPPAALASAMGRDRKPFTYTPGGLDLSEIKSERMAKRLMRNAMNQGVPERPMQIQSPPTPTTPIAVPNYNCMPVQVFPVNLPANPKSLLRTRSIPGQPRDPPPDWGPPPQFVNNAKPFATSQNNVFNNNTATYYTPPQISNNRPASMYEYSPNNFHSINYGSVGQTAIPEMSYGAQFLQAPPKTNFQSVVPPVPAKSDYSFDNNNVTHKTEEDVPLFENNSKFVPEIKKNVTTQDVILPIIETKANDVIIEPVKGLSTPQEIASKPKDEDQGTIEQKEVKVVTKQVRQESSVKETNGNQNGDTEAEAEMTVTLPSKKSAAKTETKTEILKKSLPDGSVEEITKTITKTTIDGKTEIKTKTETRILPKEDADEEEVEEELEEENGEVEETEEPQVISTVFKTESNTPKENGQSSIIKTQESSETSTTSTKKVVIVQDDNDEQEEEVEEEVEEEIEDEVEAEPVTFVIKKPTEKPPTPIPQTKPDEVEEKVEQEEETEEIVVEKELQESQKQVEEQLEEENQKSEEVEEEIEEVEEEDEYEEAEEKKEETTKFAESVVESETESKEVKKNENDAYDETSAAEKTVEEPVEKSVEKQVDEPIEESVEELKAVETEAKQDEPEEKQDVITEEKKEVTFDEKEEVTVEKQALKSDNTRVQEVILTPKIEKSDPFEKPLLREPSVPLEKVEDVEIKPIGAGDFVSKSHTESTEIIKNSADRPGLVTEYNRTENIVTVKRTIETLDNNFDKSQSIPPVTNFFTPHVEKIASPQPSRPYQPVYPSEPQTERRHSLLLERLSMERQIPSDIYQNSQYTNQIEQQRQMSQEPQAEVLTVSNIKPSSITKNSQEWYQQTKREAYNSSTPVPQVTPSWTQPQPQPPPQPLFAPQPQFRQPSPQPQYTPSYTDNTQNTTMYTSYTSKPTTWAPNTSNLESSTQSNQYSYSSKDSYQNTQQQFTSSYVPPPWEQDSTYVVETPQNYYQPPPQTSTFSPTPSQGWKSTLPTSKFTKPAPTAYIPPKPNQSFVKPVINVEPPNTPGRKTYYSEYERRYITVPESVYIPAETKYQPQPDPSPQYYYDNNEPTEPVEHQWRKELREFTEKTQTQVTTETSVQPPWQTDAKFAKAPEVSYTPTPTWSQTVRPQSWRERSFESEFVSQEWPKTNTLGRGRPLSSYGKESIPQRTRGVSVDRYNPNNYQAPVAAEHPPVQTYTHAPPAPHATGHHNANVPAYHARASAEPREQPMYQQPRPMREPRASPFQSRSFKYLQWITGTDD